MPGGTGDVGPVAATSIRPMSWPSNRSARISHHSGSAEVFAALPAVAALPVLSHA